MCFPTSVIFKITQGLGAAVFYEERDFVSMILFQCEFY